MENNLDIQNNSAYSLNMKILTTFGYWNQLNNSTKKYWRKVTQRMPGIVICTHRPNLRQFRGPTQVRRCSTGGRWGKSADIVRLSIVNLENSGYIFVE